jgi:hypothetical protein
MRQAGQKTRFLPGVSTLEQFHFEIAPEQRTNERREPPL